MTDHGERLSQLCLAWLEALAEEGPAMDCAAEVLALLSRPETIRVRDLDHLTTCRIFAGGDSCSCGAVAAAVARDANSQSVPE